MKRKLSALFIVVACLLLLTACASDGVVDSGLSHGTYAINQNADMPQITFDILDRSESVHGSFCYQDGDMQISGTTRIKNGYVILTPQNSDAEYRFEIVSYDVIIFRLKKSSVLYRADGITPIEDGTSFHFTGER